ncbi:uncharacterized protein DUF4351 [Halanaerobium saccharolyticum]|uniref:Uncharacterized protein DUF4351 n=1 Tax=Halanaerobium saccharolyticum TaxID=43595 RepID=A0A4R7YX79_9FIRM|nr:DUF4351 domain-containing protein [Halanaerobium saccharolyticum]RAK06294.1 uncharacterized protein DUF4351 [Halanaerobium saccharolyticum]TDW00773.1 uncharacterized protein DUF4351 [Halanaerobium saccharolyticum]TDX52415.1 uncharacterized protein DUF4351 [Halanaerobium saccharolyticum]
MQHFDVTAHNYDFVFKDSFNLFKNDIADFLKVEMPGIASYLETEFTEVETNTERMDLNFKLEDGSILHLEEEIEVSVDDLIRFASYDLKLYNRYRDRIRTIILCIKGYPASEAAFNAGSLGYNTTVVNMSDKDGKEKLKELKDKIEKKEKINYLDLIFLPLMKSDQKMVKRVKETIELEDKLDADQKFKNNLAALTIVLCDKFLSSENMIELWRDRKMVKFFKYVEEQGKKKGKEEGKIEGKQEEARLILMRQIKAKFGDTDNEIIKLINRAELSKIEDLSEKIITSDSTEDIIDFLKH